MSTSKQKLSLLMIFTLMFSLMFSGFTAFAATGTTAVQDTPPVIEAHPTYGLSAQAYDGFPPATTDGYGDYIDTFFSVNEAVYSMDVTAYAGDPTDPSVPTVKITGSKADNTQIGLSTSYAEANDDPGNELYPNSKAQLDAFFTALKFAVNPQVKIVVSDAAGNTAEKTIPLKTDSIVYHTELVKYNAALVAVHEANYTVNSWAAYKTVLDANAMTDANTQAQVNAATAAIVAAQTDLVLKSNIATVTSSVYTVSENGTDSETVTGVTYGTRKGDFLTGLSKGEANQTWDDTAISEPVATGDKLVVTAENGQAVVTYTITVDADKTALTSVIDDQYSDPDRSVYKFEPIEYSETRWTEYANAIQAGIEIEGNQHVTQAQVDAAVEAIITAKAELNPLVKSIDGTNILLVGHYAFDLNNEDSGFILNNFLRAAQTAYLNYDTGEYEVYFNLNGVWYNIVTDSTMTTPVEPSVINGDGHYRFMNMR